MIQFQEFILKVRDQRELKRMKEGILAQRVKMPRPGISNKTNGEMNQPQLPKKMRAMKHLGNIRLGRFEVPSSICCLANLRELI
ncbi:hypothetical protein SUGI_0388490 [Cryptomeria japonica]|nr:hypothetical protein SUGI_0388490 [Cryptomeria japonica]